jgi:hypothetical protein
MSEKQYERKHEKDRKQLTYGPFPLFLHQLTKQSGQAEDKQG